MQDFEKTGDFYLGKIVDSNGELTDKLLLYPSKNLTTHAVCVGMTGSGKTGLGIIVLEEAALDKIPAIIIDPKGDLGNLLLTFPTLSTAEFSPWIDKAEAERKEMSPNDYAESVSKTWKEGLAKWDEGPDRIQKLKNSVDMMIYTPASNAGVPLSILSSFAAPSKELMLDTGAIRDRVLTTTSSILGLLGIAADPIKSREHILISTLIMQAWNQGKDLDIPTLIQQVQNPPFDKIGVLDIDTFFPPKERLALSINLNNLLASPGFQAWMEGDSLDINQLLWNKEGKPKLLIISIAHLSDAERMFFVTLLLNEIISWMRRQPGTSSLRALLYMDEIFGFFPPIAVPPSKIPMLTLLKQARAYGLGIMLCTQNPVDLDYKGLSNCGTWFIGKLQTERDKARVLEGLTIASNGEIESSELNKMLASIAARTFIMRSIHEKEPVLFQTRWTMSYLRGPLTLSQIKTLSEQGSWIKSTPSIQLKQTNSVDLKPIVPPEIPEFFINPSRSTQKVIYKPQIAGLAKLHFVDSKLQIDTWQDVCFISPVDENGKTVLWEEGKKVIDIKNYMDKEPLSGSTFQELPAGLMQEKNYASFEKSFLTFLYQNQVYNIFKSVYLNLISNENETENEFRSRVVLAMKSEQNESIKKVKNKYADKINALTEKIRRVQDKLEQKQQKTFMQKIETFLSFLTTIIGAIFGRKLTKTTITQTGTSMRRAGKISTDSQEAARVEGDLKTYQQQLEDLQKELNDEIQKLSSVDASSIELETITIRPRKSDISVEKIALAWWPLQ